ncbi:MAG: hypothetical protein J0H53_03050 [Rhizobiales bacterium]|nr:hypothetical protein [Hyphomicrobiales bacterium]
MKTMISAAMISLALAGSALAADVRPGVSFAGTPEAEIELAIARLGDSLRRLYS